MRRSSLGLSDSLHLSLSAQLGPEADGRPAISPRVPYMSKLLFEDKLIA